MTRLLIFFKKKRLYCWIVLLLLLEVPSFISLLQPGYFYHHDDLQVMRIYEMDKCFKDGQIPCRWVPDMGYGYGYPLFNYYPVMPYYLGELIHSLGFSLIWSVKIDFILSLMVSAVTMFFLGKKLWGNLGGAMSALFYLYAPYHAVDVYVRGAMAESWSLSWTPAVFLMIVAVIEKSSIKNILLLALFIALFLMSHNPMALVFVPIMLIWALIYLLHSKRWQSVKNLIISGLWGLGLAAFFTLPVLLESSLVHIETLFIGYFNYLAHFVTLNQLFISRFWGYGGSIYGVSDGMSFQIGWLHWGGVVISLGLIIWLWKKYRMSAMLILFLFSTFWGSAFLMHQRSTFIWEKITILQTLQFPWRLLAVTIFSSSLILGSFFKFIPTRVGKSILVVAAVLGIVIFYQPYFKIKEIIPLTDQQKLSGALWDLQRNAGIFDYLPKTAKFPPADPVKETVQVITGAAKIDSFTRGTNWLSFNTSSTISTTLRLPIYDFPIWKVLVDGQESSFDNHNDLGEPTFNVSAGHHQIYAKLFDTPVRQVANLISLLAGVGFVAAWLKYGKR